MELGNKEKTMENKTNKESMAFIIGLVLVVITGIACVTFYNYQELQAMKSNVESAIVKGIDPVAVKCAYKNGDTICALYAANHTKQAISLDSTKK